MRKFGFLISLIIIFSSLILGFTIFIKSELGYIRIFVPSVDNLSSYNEEVSLTIYGANDLLMYKKFYRMSERLDKGFELSALSAMVDVLIEDKRNDTNQHGIERWKLYLMKLEGIDPFSLKGIVLAHYADQILNDTNITGFRAEALRWYTLEKINKSYSEGELYRMFLDTQEYADNVFGIGAASRYFFRKNISECSSYEQAFLVSILSSGRSFLNPDKDFQAIDKYAHMLLKNLHDKGVIQTLNYSDFKYQKMEIKNKVYEAVDPSYVDYVIKAVKSDGRFKIGEDSIVIRTGYNQNASEVAYQILYDYMKTKDNRLQAAFVLINKRTRAVEAVIGSRVKTSTTNRALSMKRQTASTFKPIVYLTAFSKGLRPSTQIVDKPYTFKSGPFLYSPRNYKDIFLGQIPLRYGITYSLNNATIKLAEDVGLQNVMKTAVDLGMDSEIHPYHAMAIGSFPTTPLNLAQIYSTLANYGERRMPSMILSVEKNGEIFNMLEEERRVVDNASAFQTLYIMQDVVERGTARGADMLKGTAAKTGTSDKFRDAWTVAIFGDYVAVSWVGYDNYDSMGEDSEGGRIAAPLIAKFQQAYFEHDTEFGIIPPNDIVFKRVYKYTDMLTEKEGRNTRIEAFKDSNLPPLEIVKGKKKK